MIFDWHMWYPLHTVILDNSQAFRGVPCRAQLCNFSKWFFSCRFGVVPIWELWQFWGVCKGPLKMEAYRTHLAGYPPKLPPVMEECCSPLQCSMQGTGGTCGGNLLFSVPTIHNL